MENKLECLRRTCSGKGIFDGYEIFGFRYSDGAGKDGWLITVWVTNQNPVNTYWLEGGEFFVPRVQYGYNFSDNILVETFGKVTDIDDKKKAVVFRAIAEWEEVGKP